MTAPRQATQHAAEMAEVAHGGVGHGDNHPDDTRALLIDRAIVDRREPPLPPPSRVGGLGPEGRPNCSSWDDHLRPGEQPGRLATSTWCCQPDADGFHQPRCPESLRISYREAAADG